MSANKQKNRQQQLGDITEQLDRIAEQINVQPCVEFNEQDGTCLRREADHAKERGVGYSSYRHYMLCESCAVYWHTTMAAIQLRAYLKS